MQSRPEFILSLTSQMHSFKRIRNSRRKGGVRHVHDPPRQSCRRGSFVGYRAAVALAEAVRALPREDCLNLRASFEKAKELASKLPKVSDRLTVLESAKAELARKCPDATYSGPIRAPECE